MQHIHVHVYASHTFLYIICCCTGINFFTLPHPCRLPSGAEYMFAGKDDSDASVWVSAIRNAIQDGRSLILVCFELYRVVC